jgi:hypothetical protein
VRILTTQTEQYGDTRNYLLLFVGISLLVVGSTLAVSVACYRNFDKGLKPYSKRSQSLTNDLVLKNKYGREVAEGSTVERRTIDLE